MRGFKKKRKTWPSRARPTQGAPSQVWLEAPNIPNFQCPRAPADTCVLSQPDPKDVVFSTFDPMKGTLRQVAKLAEAPGGWNFSLSPDGTVIAAVELSVIKHQIQLVSLS